MNTRKSCLVSNCFLPLVDRRLNKYRGTRLLEGGTYVRDQKYDNYNAGYYTDSQGKQSKPEPQTNA